METMSKTPPSSSSSLPPPRIFIRSTRLKVSTHIDVQLETLDTRAKISVTALLDSGATGMFLDTKWVKAHSLNTRKLARAIPVYNVDGTLNQGGSISEEIDLLMVYQNHSEKATFAVCDLGDKAAIIGHTWLFRHNPEIDWQSGKVTFSRCPPLCHMNVQKVQKQSKKIRQLVPMLCPHPEESKEDLSSSSEFSVLMELLDWMILVGKV